MTSLYFAAGFLAFPVVIVLLFLLLQRRIVLPTDIRVAQELQDRGAQPFGAVVDALHTIRSAVACLRGWLHAWANRLALGPPVTPCRVRAAVAVVDRVVAFGQG